MGYVTVQAVCGAGITLSDWISHRPDDLLPAGQEVRYDAQCEPGESMVSGGFESGDGARVTDSFPLGDGSGWGMYAYTDTAGWMDSAVVCGT